MLKIAEFARIPPAQSEVVMLTTLLLPGTAIVYYGDELGMSDSASAISCEDTMDPYAKEPYAECDGYPEQSRDPARTPMQVRGAAYSCLAEVYFLQAQRKHFLPLRVLMDKYREYEYVYL